MGGGGAGQAVGGTGGSIAGGLIGSALLPGAGTIIGAGLGGLAGGAAGSALGGGAAPATASYGGNPQTYIGTAAPAADLSYQQTAGFGAGAGAPGTYGYAAGQLPNVNPETQAYLTGLNYQGMTPNVSPYLFNTGAGSTADQFSTGATNAANYWANTGWPAVSGAPTALAGNAYNLYNNLSPTLMANAQNPLYGQLVSQAGANPYYNLAVGGALSGAEYGGTAAGQAAGGSNYLNQLAPSLYGQGQTAGNLITGLAAPTAGYGAAATAPAAGLQNLGTGLYGNITGAAKPLQGLAQSIINQGFDPQSALFNQLQTQVSNQSQAANAAAGVGTSPYGASVTGNTLGNFDINWQNNLLQRQTQAANAANNVQNTIAGIYAQGGATDAALQNTAANLYGMGGSLNTAAGNLYGSGYNQNLLGATAAGNALNTGLTLGQGAAGLAASAAAAPGAAYMSNLSQQIPFLQAQSGAGINNATALNTLLGGQGTALNNALNIGQGITGTTYGAGMLPYQTDQTIGQNYLSNLSNLQGLNAQIGQTGASAFNLPQNYLQLLQNYMTGTNNAVSNAVSQGQTGLNELGGGLSGAISGANTLFNPKTGLFPNAASGVGNWLSSLFSSTPGDVVP